MSQWYDSNSEIPLSIISAWRWTENAIIEVYVNRTWYVYSDGSTLNRDLQELKDNGIPQNQN